MKKPSKWQKNYDALRWWQKMDFWINPHEWMRYWELEELRAELVAEIAKYDAVMAFSKKDNG